MSAIPTMVRAKVTHRDQGRCVRCWMPATNKHHRRRRREDHDGKSHSPANLITLCGMGNVTGCHGWVHKNPVAARAEGYTLRPDQDPEVEPLQHVRWGRIRLADDGTYALAA